MTTDKQSMVHGNGEPGEKSLAGNTAWAVIGNVFHAGGRFLLVIILTHYFSSEQVGRVLYALAVVTPLAFLINMELRTVYITDTNDWVTAGHCLALRSVSNIILLVLLLILCAAPWPKWDHQLIILILLVGAVRMAESWSDIYWGVLQKNECMKNVSISQVLRTVSVLIFSFIIAQFTDNIQWMLLGWAVITLGVLWFYDRTKAARLTPVSWLWQMQTCKRLGWLAFPVGVFVALAILNQQVAQYFIRPTLGDSTVAYFGVMISFVSGIAAVQNGVNQAVLPRLSNYFNSSRNDFWKLLAKITSISSMIMAAMLLLIWWRGDLILKILYGPEYAQHAGLFVVVMGSGWIIVLGMIAGDALLACHRFKSRMVAMALGLTANAFICWYFIGQYQLAAPAWAAVISSGIILMICAGMLAQASLKKKS
ncbi:MAG: hypothetical protein GY869_04670 [Planctomycetes bacterium]|nr:hypothetical protein [Planctomycetota bacterium]